MKKLKAFLGATILGTSISLAGCGTGNFQSYTESQQAEIESMSEEKESLSYEIEALEQQREELERETEKLASEKESLEETNENLSIEIENKQQELESLSQEEHDLKNLYFLDTSLIDPSGSKIYYILEKERIGCIPIGCETSGECFYRDSDYKDSGKRTFCFAEVFNSIGLINDITFRVEAHWPDNIYEEESYFSIVSNPDYYMYTVNTAPGSIDHNAQNNKIYNDFYSIIVPLENILKDEETKPSYTTKEIINMMNNMNTEEYDIEDERSFLLRLEK